MHKNFALAAALATAAPGAALAQIAGSGARADGVEITVAARTPEQTRAFYEARGFPPDALRELAGACFMTIGVHNGRNGTVWLEPAAWRFVTDDGQPVRQIGREHWEARWQALGVPAAARAAFGWTQLPVRRDLQPGEPVGGNLAVVPQNRPFTLEAVFALGERREQGTLRLRVPRLRCAPGDPPGAAPEPGPGLTTGAPKAAAPAPAAAKITALESRASDPEKSQ